MTEIFFLLGSIYVCMLIQSLLCLTKILSDYSLLLMEECKGLRDFRNCVCAFYHRMHFGISQIYLPHLYDVEKRSLPCVTASLMLNSSRILNSISALLFFLSLLHSCSVWASSWLSCMGKINDTPNLPIIIIQKNLHPHHAYIKSLVQPKSGSL